MQDILKIREELSQVICDNNNILTNEQVIIKALEAETKISRLTNK